jgi:hypothetical protein
MTSQVEDLQAQSTHEISTPPSVDEEKNFMHVFFMLFLFLRKLINTYAVVYSMKRLSMFHSTFIKIRYKFF